MNKTELLEGVGYNQIGWFALRHRKGWWLGNDKGVICYRDKDIASAALTIAWQREGGHRLDYRIEVFPAFIKLKDTGTHTPPKSAEQALRDYEKRKDINV